MLTAQRVRTSLLIGAAGAAVLAGVALGPARPAPAARAAAVEGHCAERVAAVPAVVTRAERPPVALVLLLDTSGSSDGGPLEEVKADADRLLDTLAAADTVSIIAFSTRATVVLGTMTADANGRAHAREAIGELKQGGSTCISCGLTAAQDELARTRGALDLAPRIVLVSDGRANDGLWDADELVAQAALVAGPGVGITTIAVGREADADEATLERIAHAGHGRWYPSSFGSKLGVLFARELGR